MRSYYLALRFRSRNDLHMTLHYYESLTPLQVAGVIYTVDEVLNESVSKRFKVLLPLEGWFGRRNDIRALQPRSALPVWVRRLATVGLVPHVTCDDPAPLELTVDAVALMKKSNEVVRWRLG